MNDDRTSEIIRLLDSIDTTLREVNGKLDKPETIVHNVHNMPLMCAGIDAGKLRETIRSAVRRECGPATITNILVTPETEVDRQGLDKWLEQLDKCQCPIQVHVEHDGCCEHKGKNGE